MLARLYSLRSNVCIMALRYHHPYTIYTYIYINSTEYKFAGIFVNIFLLLLLLRLFSVGFSFLVHTLLFPCKHWNGNDWKTVVLVRFKLNFFFLYLCWSLKAFFIISLMPACAQNIIKFTPNFRLTSKNGLMKMIWSMLCVRFLLDTLKRYYELIHSTLPAMFTCFNVHLINDEHWIHYANNKYHLRGIYEIFSFFFFPLFLLEKKIKRSERMAALFIFC